MISQHKTKANKSERQQKIAGSYDYISRAAKKQLGLVVHFDLFPLQHY